MKHDETINERAERIVRQEVLVCMSHVVAALAQGYGHLNSSNKNVADLAFLGEQAFDLASPVPDYEEAALQAGWTGPHKDKFGASYFQDHTDDQTWSGNDWQELCSEFDIEPYEREVFEHWAVTDWLADKLIAKGEKVDKDFANLCVWARTTTGQGIAQDSVIQEIAADVLKPIAA